MSGRSLVFQVEAQQGTLTPRAAETEKVNMLILIVYSLCVYLHIIIEKNCTDA